MNVGDYVQVVRNEKDTVSNDFAGRRGYIAKFYEANWPHSGSETIQFGKIWKVMVDFDPNDDRATLMIFHRDSVRPVTPLDLLAEV